MRIIVEARGGGVKGKNAGRVISRRELKSSELNALGGVELLSDEAKNELASIVAETFSDARRYGHRTNSIVLTVMARREMPKQGPVRTEPDGCRKVDYWTDIRTLHRCAEDLFPAQVVRDQLAWDAVRRAKHAETLGYKPSALDNLLKNSWHGVNQQRVYDTVPPITVYLAGGYTELLADELAQTEARQRLTAHIERLLIEKERDKSND